MPVTGATTRNDYVASSGQNVFAYTFQTLLRSDLKVIQNGTALTLNNDYTVAITGQSGGFVTLSTPASSGDIVSVFLAMPIDRTTEYQNAGDFLASDVNGDFDKGYIAMNQLQTDIRRAMGLQDQDPTVNMELPLKADRASKFLAFNANGQPIVYTTPNGSGTASTYQPSFPESVSRSLQDRLEDYTSVADFGAVGNGVTDDTAALQAAFSYGNTTRTKIVMEGKTYRYSGLLATITNSVHIEGAGNGTILLKDKDYTGAAFVIDNTFGQIPEFYPNSAGDQDLVANLARVKSPSFSKFSIIGEDRKKAGFGFEVKDRNDMLSIQDVNCFNLKGSAFRFTGTFGNLRESNIRRLVVRMCGDENYPAVDLKMPSFSNTQVTSSTVGGKTRFTLSGTGDNFSGLTGNRKIRVQGSRNDGGTKEWPVESIVSNIVVELPYDITSIDPETGETYGQAVTNAPTTFYRDVDGLNHIAFNDCQIVGCYGTYLRISHDRVNFFRRVVFNNLMIHGSNKKYQDDAQQGPSGDLILLEGGIGSVDFRGLRLNTNEVDKGVTPNILYAGMRVRAGQVITQDIPDRVWINDLDMLNLNNDGEAMFVIEKVKNMSVNGTVAASSQSGTELKVTADAVDVGLDYNVIPGTSKNIRNIGVLPAFSIDDSTSDKVFITQNNRNQGFVTVKDYGAVGNGIEDDTAAFARAFASGSTIYVPKGTYLLPNWTTIVRTAKLTLKGEGVIRGVGNTDTFIDPRNDMDISGVSFEGFAFVLKNVFDESTAGINNLRFHSVIVKDCGAGISLERPISNLLVTGCDFRNITANKPIRIGKNEASAQNTWKHLTITDNKFRAISTTGDADCNAILVYGRQAVISNNVFTTIGAVGAFDTFSGDGSDTTFTVSESGLNEGQCTVYINDVEQINTDDTTLWTLDGTTLTFTTAPVSGTDNIKFYYVGESAAIYTKARFATITGNTISGLGRLPDGGFTLNVNQIYGINVKGRGRGDTSAPQGYSVTVTGNTLEGVNGLGSGIRIQNDCVNVTGNSIERFRWGINGNTAVHDDSNISNNNIYHCSQYGINFIQSGTNAIMQGNNITGVDVGSGVYEPLIAIHVKAHSDTENYNISNNSISGCKKGIKISGSSTAGAEISNVLITNNTLSSVTGNGIEFADCNTITVDNNQYKGEVTNQFIRPVSPNQNVTVRDSRTKAYNTNAAVTLQTWNTSIVDQAVRVTASVTAKQGDAEFAAYKITGLFKVDSGTLTQVGSTATEYAITSSGAASWGGASFLAFEGDLLLRVQGTSATPDTQWSAKTEYVSTTDASF